MSRFYTFYVQTLLFLSSLLTMQQHGTSQYLCMSCLSCLEVQGMVVKQQLGGTAAKPGTSSVDGVILKCKRETPQYFCRPQLCLWQQKQVFQTKNNLLLKHNIDILNVENCKDAICLSKTSVLYPFNSLWTKYGVTHVLQQTLPLVFLSFFMTNQPLNLSICIPNLFKCE